MLLIELAMVVRFVVQRRRREWLLDDIDNSLIGIWVSWYLFSSEWPWGDVTRIHAALGGSLLLCIDPLYVLAQLFFSIFTIKKLLIVIDQRFFSKTPLTSFKPSKWSLLPNPADISASILLARVNPMKHDSNHSRASSLFVLEMVISILQIRWTEGYLLNLKG